MTIYGINPVLEALRAGRVTALRVSQRNDDRLRELIALASNRGVAVRRVPPDVLDRDSRRGVHQGVVADVEEQRDYSLAELVKGAPAAPLIVVLDGVEDPHNLGAVIRTSEACGVSGVVVPERHSAPLSATVAKASAGALAHMAVVRVGNIASTLAQFKDKGIWVAGVDEEGDRLWTEFDYTVPIALVFGGEHRGLRRLVRENCDVVVRLPMFGRVAALNVSVAAGVVLYEVVRQRNSAGSGRIAAKS